MSGVTFARARGAYYTAGVVCATLAVVAAVCSHNHAHAPYAAAALALCGGGMLWRWRALARVA